MCMVDIIPMFCMVKLSLRGADSLTCPGACGESVADRDLNSGLSDTRYCDSSVRFPAGGSRLYAWARNMYKKYSRLVVLKLQHGS